MTDPTEIEQPKRDVKLRTGSFRPVEVLTSHWDAIMAPEHDYKDCFNPAYWSINALKASRDDIIHVRTEDQRFYAELYVVDANRQGLSVIELAYYDLQKAVPALADDTEYFVKWRGPTHRWCVVRKSDNAVMQTLIASKLEAITWIQIKVAA